MKYSLRVLFVDDEEVIHQTIAGYMRDLGHHVDGVYDGDAALGSIETHGYDLAIVDMLIPGIGGLSILDKAQEIRPEMPVIIITGYETMDIAIQAFSRGAIEFLTKPIKLLELDAALEKCIRMHEYISLNHC